MLKPTNLCWNLFHPWFSIVIGDTFLMLYSILCTLVKISNLCWKTSIYVEHSEFMLKTLPLCWTYWIYVETHRCVVCRDGTHLACLPDATHDRCRYEGNKISDHMILCWNATNLCWNVMDLMLKHTNLCWNELCAWVSVVIGDIFLVLLSTLFTLLRNLEFMLKTMNLCWIPWIYVENQWTVACPEMESTLCATGADVPLSVCREEILWP